MIIKLRSTISLLLIFLLTLTIAITPAVANPMNDIFSTLTANSPNNIGVSDQVKANKKLHNAPHAEKVAFFVYHGLTKEEGEYYATLDDQILKLEKENKKIDLTNVTAMSEKEIESDLYGFKKKILALYPAAIKAGLNSKVYKQGFADINELMKKDPGKDKYEITYPDGSKIGFVSGAKKGIQKDKTPPEREAYGYYGDDWGYDTNYAYNKYWSLYQSPGHWIGGYTYWYITSSIGTSYVGIDDVDYYISSSRDSAQVYSYNAWFSTSGIFSADYAITIAQGYANNSSPAYLINCVYLNLSQALSYYDNFGHNTVDTSDSYNYFQMCTFELDCNGQLKGWADIYFL